MESWSSAGRKTEQRFALPKGQEQIEQLILNENGWAALLPSRGQATWSRCPVRQEWLDNRRRASWPIRSVVRAGQRRLVGHRARVLTVVEPPRYLLFNTADGSAAAPLPKTTECYALGHSSRMDDEWKVPLACAHPYADFLKLSPFQLGYDTSIEMSQSEARRALQAVLTRHPAFRHLHFVRHGCHGENCIGAVVENVQEADDVRTYLEAAVNTIVKADTSNNGPPPTWLLSHSAPRCLPPPETTPFPVPR